jgi:hypothetical protein
LQGIDLQVKSTQYLYEASFSYTVTTCYAFVLFNTIELSDELHPYRGNLMPTDEELEQEFNRNHDWLVFEEGEDETESTKTLLTRLYRSATQRKALSLNKASTPQNPYGN